MKVAITGGIGSGKTYVCSVLRQRGVEVYDCDNAAKRIMRTSVSVRRSLEKLIGISAYQDGKPNKAAIASYILASEDNAKKVNAVVHPAVAADFLESGICFMECAILFSSGFNKLVDKVVCVTAPLDVRLDRIMKRDSISRQKAQEWIDCQMPQEEVAAMSDHVVVNDGNAPVSLLVDRMLEDLEKENSINNIIKE